MMRLGVSLLISTAVAVPGAQFRSTTARVAVNVAVMNGDMPIAGLSSADFTLTDNGIPQEIEAVTLDAIPVDVSLVVDVSGSTSAELESYRRDIPALRALLRPIDQLRAIVFENGVTEVIPLRSPVTSLSLNLDSGRASAVYDGIGAALLRRSAAGRRHLIAVYTDGAENRSILTAGQLLAAARSSDAVIHLVTPRALPYVIETDQPCRLGAKIEINAAPGPKCAGAPALQHIVETTGGQVHLGTELAGTFRAILKEYLRGYVLYFRPVGVAPSGWHELVVSVPGHPRAKVHARRGYLGG